MQQVAVIVGEAEEYKVGGRVAAMILWLLEREQEINVLYQGNIQFHFKGDKLRSSKQELDVDVKVPWPACDG